MSNILETPLTTPEGVITASPGTLVQSSTGKLFIKKSGTGNTGWDEAGNSTNVPNSPNSVLAPVAIANLPTGGVIGTDSTTVDVNSAFNISQTTPGQNITLPVPVLLIGARLVTVTNTGSVAFTMYGTEIPAGASKIIVWTGASGTWVVAGERGDIPSLTKTITQTAHGFVVGNWIAHNGTIYTKVNPAGTFAEQQSLGVIAAGGVVDANNFILTTSGVADLTGATYAPLTVGAAYYPHSITPGLATTSRAIGITKSLFNAVSTTSGFIVADNGQEIQTVVFQGSPTILTATMGTMYKWDTSGGSGNQILLPTAVGKNSQSISVYRNTSDANSLSVVPNLLEVINGVNAPVAVSGQYKIYTFTSDNVGWVMQSPEGYFEGATGTASLAATYTVTGTYADTGLQVVLPSAGDYLVSASISGTITDSSVTGSVMRARFTDTTGTIIYGEEWTVVGRDEDTATASGMFSSGSSMSKITGATAGQVIKVQAIVNNTPTTAQIFGVGGTAGGKSSIVYQKVGGYLPVNTSAEYGEQVLSGSVNIANTSTNQSNATDIMSFTIPSAGTWEVPYTVRGVSNESSADQVIGMVALITDNSNNVIPDSEIMLARHRGGNTSGVANSLQVSGTGYIRITTTGATTYKIRGHNDGSSGALTWSVSSDGNGKTKVSWNKIAGLTPLNAIPRVNVICRNKTAQSIPSSSWGNLTNWTEIQDPTSSFDPVTGVFTAPRTASYAFSTGNGFTVGTGNYVGQAVWLNNATQLYNFLIISPTLGVSYIQTNGVIEMTAGQTLQARTFNGSVSAPNDNPSASNSWFTITEINNFY